MGVIIGVIVGYVMGAKAGEQGLVEAKEAWATIRASDEARDLVAGGMSVAAGLLRRGGAMLAERLQQVGAPTGSLTALRPTA